MVRFRPEHNPRLADGISALQYALEVEDNGCKQIDYRHLHRVLAEGDFVLCVSEGNFSADHCAFYNLFRVAHGKIVEHWDTREKIAPRSEWKNDNGKFWTLDDTASAKSSRVFFLSIAFVSTPVLKPSSTLFRRSR